MILEFALTEREQIRFSFLTVGNGSVKVVNANVASSSDL